MNLNRRNFLSGLATVAAAALAGVEVDVDRLLWVPGRKTIFLPSEPVRIFGVDWASGPDQIVWTTLQPYGSDGLIREAVMSKEQFDTWSRGTFGVKYQPPILPLGWEPEYWFTAGRRAGKTTAQRRIRRCLDDVERLR